MNCWISVASEQRDALRSEPLFGDCHELLGDATYEGAIGCLPSVANMWQQNVIDLAKASENYAKQKPKRAGTASSTRSVRCLSRR